MKRTIKKKLTLSKSLLTIIVFTLGTPSVVSAFQQICDPADTPGVYWPTGYGTHYANVSPANIRIEFLQTDLNGGEPVSVRIIDVQVPQTWWPNSSKIVTANGHVWGYPLLEAIAAQDDLVIAGPIRKYHVDGTPNDLPGCVNCIPCDCLTMTVNAVPGTRIAIRGISTANDPLPAIGAINDMPDLAGGAAPWPPAGAPWWLWLPNIPEQYNYDYIEYGGQVPDPLGLVGAHCVARWPDWGEPFQVQTTTLSYDNETYIPYEEGAYFSEWAMNAPPNHTGFIQVESFLSWVPPIDPQIEQVVGYNVYMDPNESLVAMRSGCAWTSLDQPETTFDPVPDMEYKTTYFWCVDAVVIMNGDADTLPGNVWSFKTVPEIVITDHPTDTAAFQGETAEFTISVDSATPPNFEWYKTPDDANHIPDDDVLISAGSDSLIISPVTIDDEGYYYCKVNNEGTEVVYSDVPALGVLRPVAYWDLNGHYHDNSGESHDAEPAGTPLFVTGIVGEGVQIDPDNGWASAGTWDPSQYTGQLSLSLWARWDGENGDKQGLISKRNAWAVDEMMWQLEIAQDTGDLRFMSTSDTISSPVLLNGEWEHVAVTFDGETATLYRDGVSVSSGVFEFDFKTDANLTIGAGQRDDMGVASYTFNGALDEIQIYNYALTKYEVADLYFFGSGESVCLDRPLYDFDGDCIVNLSDLATFVAKWLDCGLYPESECP